MTKVLNPQRPFGDINILPINGSRDLEVVVCFYTEDMDAFFDRSKSEMCIGLDASSSMKKAYCSFVGVKKVEEFVRRTVKSFAPLMTSNTISLFYWALNEAKGSSTDDSIGKLSEKDLAIPPGTPGALEILGPDSSRMGNKTKITPAIDYIARITDGLKADQCKLMLGVIVTDGMINDEPAAMKRCFEIAKEILEGKRINTKFVIVGIGNQIDREQLEQFDDMFEESVIAKTAGVELDERMKLAGKIDLWTHIILSDISSDQEIVNQAFLAELINEDTIVIEEPCTLSVRCSRQDRIVIQEEKPLPGKLRFQVPRDAESIVLECRVGDHRKVYSQSIRDALNAPTSNN